MKSSVAFIKRVITNRLAQLFGVAHLIAIVFLYSWAGGKEISSHNFYYQPFLLIFFAYINLPSMLIAGLLFAPFVAVKNFPEQNSALTISSYFFVLIVLSFIQWLLVGYSISKIIKR